MGAVLNQRPDLWRGAIAAVPGNLTISDSTFSNNFANEAGGAIINADGGIVTLTRCTLESNHGTTEVLGGGAIFAAWPPL